MHGTTRHTRRSFSLYNYRDTALLGAVNSTLCSPHTIADPVSRLRTTAVAGWKIGLGTDGIANFDPPRGGNGPRTRRRGDGGGRRGIGFSNNIFEQCLSNACQTQQQNDRPVKKNWVRGTNSVQPNKRDLPRVQVKGKKKDGRERKKSRTVYGTAI